MTDIVLTPITSGYNLSKINSNFVKVETAINNDVLHNVGGNNVMHQDLDMNSFSLLNLGTNVDDPNSLLTVAEGDARYYNIEGDSLEGTMDVAGQSIVNVAAPVVPTNPVRKLEMDAEISARAAADAALASAIAGGAPAAAQFAPISWHAQVVPNSVTIPANQNAWSFGPTLAIAPGQSVTVGTGSFWTISNGTLV